MELEGIAQRIIKQMEAEGKVTTLSAKASAEIDYKLGLELASIKKDFEKKERCSRAYISDVESGRINFPELSIFYKK